MDIVGAWSLHSWLIHYPDQREPASPYGSDPHGLLLYHPEGWMSATVNRKKRDSFPAGLSPRQLEPSRVADSYWSFFHYSGPWRIEGDQVIHTVRHSLNPNMVGTEQIRHAKLEEPVLSLMGIEAVGDSSRHHELIWHRLNK